MSNIIDIRSPLQAQLVSIHVDTGQQVQKGTLVATLELMKMQHAIEAPENGIITVTTNAEGQMIDEGQPIARIEVNDKQSRNTDAQAPEPTASALLELRNARALTMDVARPDAMAMRHAKGKRSARENISDLIDPESFREYGQLVFAAQRTRRDVDDLKRNTPADGLVAGLATINSDTAQKNDACVVMHYDYTVLAGTQGAMNHAKTDRLLKIAEADQRPVVFFTEGGGGRPGDVDVQTIAGLHVPSFAALARLRGQVPLIGVASGYCFAGNAAFLGCCDVVIATKDASIGMGGPAMIEGGGLGRYAPDEVGPASVQFQNGVVDLLVDDEAAAVTAAREYLAFFQGDQKSWRKTPAEESLNQAIPDNRLTVYDMHAVLAAIADDDSLMTLRSGYAPGMITALARVAGKPIGMIANNPAVMAGAITHDAADKAAAFLKLCDRHGLPIVSFCDTPGIMVGPESEQQGNVRFASELFLTGASLSVPMMMVVVRKAYGLGAMAMAGGGFHETRATVSWPSGEFGAMGIEGAVKLGYRRELAAIDDDTEREAALNARIRDAYERGKAINAAPFFEFDAVIEPAETRAWIQTMLSARKDA